MLLTFLRVNYQTNSSMWPLSFQRSLNICFCQADSSWLVQLPSKLLQTGSHIIHELSQISQTICQNFCVYVLNIFLGNFCLEANVTIRQHLGNISFPWGFMPLFIDAPPSSNPEGEMYFLWEWFSSLFPHLFSWKQEMKKCEQWNWTNYKLHLFLAGSRPTYYLCSAGGQISCFRLLFA